ncbi:MAG TPA: hypothetical protein VLB90_06065 [Pseudomonadales bacterium]|nr:hypothetical protein [Pseudomonadales bacterium]
MALNLKKMNLKKLASPLLASCLLMSSVNVMASASNPFDDSHPSALAMTTDLIILRPVGVVATVLGSVMWVVAAPFTLPVGGGTEAYDVLMKEPATYTFFRCLGCTRPGYNRDAADEEAKETEANYN